MKQAALILLLFLSCSSLARGQAGQATEIKSGAALPATCTPTRGWLFWNTSTNLMYDCTATNTWTQVGTGAVGGVASVFGRTGTVTAQVGDITAANTNGLAGSGSDPLLAFFLSPNCPVANTGQCFNTPADTQQVQDCAWTAATPSAVTCASNHFVAGDVGKQVMGWKTCQAFQSNANSGANAITATGAPVITAFNSATSVNITTAANAQSTQTGCFIWGHPDDSGASAVDTAVQNATFCPRLILGASNYMFTSPHFFTQPTACGNDSVIFNSTFGNIYYSGGFELEGRGNGNTIIYLTTNFPNGDTCSHTMTGFPATPTNTGCFVIPLEGRWRDFQINGGSQMAPTSINYNNKALILAQVGSIDNFNCINYGGFFDPASIAFYGIVMSFQVQLNQVANSGCGNIGIATSQGTSGQFMFKTSIENSRDVDFINYGLTVTCEFCQMFANQYPTTANSYEIWNNGGTLILRDSVIDSGGSTGPVNLNTVYTSTADNSQLYSDNSQLLPGTAAGSNAAIFMQHKGIVYLHNTTVQAGTTGNTYSDVTGSILVDQGGNSGFASGSGVAALNGTISGESNSSNAIGVTAAKLVLSAGWGSTAANTALTGGDAPIQFTITNSGTGQGASPTITYTFPIPYIVSPFSCAATQVGGTNANGTFTSSALSKTGVTFTFSLTPTAASTEIVQVTCVTP